MDYDIAVARGMLQRLVGMVAGRRDHLVSLSEVKQGTRCFSQRYIGIHQVPLDSIKGTESRPRDFDANFAPVQRHSRNRWESVNSATGIGISLPPVSLYKWGDAYYVRD